MALISLLAWSKKYNLVYSQAQKLVTRGIVASEKVKGKVLVDEFVQPPQTAKIACVICGAMVNQITGTHLKTHGHTIASYKAEYPNAPIVSESVSASISEAITGTVRSEETKAKVSEARRGIVPQNHPRYVKGLYSPSAETRKKMSVAQLGRTHTEETKQKIGDGNRGKIMPREDVERRATDLREAYANGTLVSSLKGTNISDEHKRKIGATQARHWQGLSPEKKAELAAIKSKALTGIKRTPEQKARYRAATLKRMQERPETFQIFKDTALELDFVAWCDTNQIEYRKQCFITYEGEQHPYDFYLPEFNALVECDGPHHWAGPYFAPRNGLTPEEEFAEQQRKDDFWTDAAIQLGYTIIRLRGIKIIGDEGSGTIEQQVSEWIDAYEKSLTKSE